MSGVRCVVFDFDGVLVDSNRIKRTAYFEVFAAVPLAARAIAEFLAARPDGDRRDVIGCVVAKMEGAGAMPDLVEMYVKRYAERCDEQLPRCPETDGASAVIAALAARYPLYVNSATPEPSLRGYLAAREWTPYFRQALGRPNSKTTNLGLIGRAEGLAGPDILFVGDRQSDLSAAREARCRFVGVRSDESDFTGSVDMLEALKLLPDYVRSLGDRRC